jgi:hypothetical protein
MKKLLAFKTVAVDTLAFQAGTTIYAGQTFKLYGDYHELNDDNVTNEGEEKILQWILSSSGRELLLRELGVGSNAFVALSVRQPVVPAGQFKPGDIDLLICGDHRADQAIAIQCKRVKVKAFSQAEDDFNKLSDVTAGIKQANLQRKNLGFHRNFLMIVIETYGQLRSSNNVLFRGPSRDTFSAIYQFPRRESLHPDVGVIFVMVSQPTGKSFKRMSVIGVCVDQEAARLDQTDELTNRISELMARACTR